MKCVMIVTKIIEFRIIETDFLKDDNPLNKV